MAWLIVAAAVFSLFVVVGWVTGRSKSSRGCSHTFKHHRGRLGPKFGSECEVCAKWGLHRHHSYKRGVPFQYRYYSAAECRYKWAIAAPLSR